MNTSSINLVLFIFILILIYLIFNKKETFIEYNIVEKVEDNTKIKVISNNKWCKDFSDRFKEHEIEENKILKNTLKLLPNNSYIIDVGGHVGDTGIYLAKILNDYHKSKNIKIILIEPDKSKLDFVKKMCKLNNLDNIILVNKGVGEKKGKCSIIKNPPPGHERHPGSWKLKINSGNIDIDTLDNICENKNISLLHLDVEGMEYQVLQGSKSLLNNVKYILIETNNKKRDKEINFLKNNNFKLVKHIYSKHGRLSNSFFKK